jgi:hypothetical protein
MRALFIILSALMFGIGNVNAQISATDMTKAQAEKALKGYVTDDVEKASQPLKKSINFIAGNYSESELKALIKNYEMAARKSAYKQGKPYIPYDKRIDVNKPSEVKRFLKKRADIIF